MLAALMPHPLNPGRLVLVSSNYFMQLNVTTQFYEKKTIHSVSHQNPASVCYYAYVSACALFIDVEVSLSHV
jgi:hypothetical protein